MATNGGLAPSTGGAEHCLERGLGNGGQRLIIVPELDMTVVVTAGAYSQPEIARTVSQLFKGIVAAAND